MSPEEMEVIEELAGSVLRELRIQTTPVDPFAIAIAEKINLISGEFDNCFDGRIELRGDGKRSEFFLFYAEEAPPARPKGRVRFSVAHELGHFYLPEHRTLLLSGQVHASHAGFVSSKTTEREADFFAAALLMPRESFISAIQSRPGRVCSLEDIRKIAAEVFETSVTSTAIRYAQLSPEPCTVVLSRERKILYSIPSEDMKGIGFGWIANGQPLPPTSVTGREANSLAKGTKVQGEIDAGVWFERSRDRRLWEEAISLGETGMVLSLLAVDRDDDD